MFFLFYICSQKVQIMFSFTSFTLEMCRAGGLGVGLERKGRECDESVGGREVEAE